MSKVLSGMPLGSKPDDPGKSETQIDEAIENARNLNMLKGHLDQVTCVVPCQNERLLASGSVDGKIIIWRLASYTQDCLLEGHSGKVRCLEVINNFLVSGSDDGTAIIWQLKKRSQETVFRGHEAGIRCLKMLEEGYLVTGPTQVTGLLFW